MITDIKTFAARNSTDKVANYAAVMQRDYYGPKTTYETLSLHDSLDDARAIAAKLQPAWPVMMSHNQYGEGTTCCAILTEIETSDWQQWPGDLYDAACRLAREDAELREQEYAEEDERVVVKLSDDDVAAHIDTSDRDYLGDAAVSIGHFVSIYRDDVLLCKTVSNLP